MGALGLWGPGWGPRTGLVSGRSPKGPAPPASGRGSQGRGRRTSWGSTGTKRPGTWAVPSEPLGPAEVSGAGGREEGARADAAGLAPPPGGRGHADFGDWKRGPRNTSPSFPTGLRPLPWTRDPRGRAGGQDPPRFPG
uniref:Uncharacterized protein n=1 Tax=Myotis myotis TaxID=51298 RepID=A0A7J7RUK2_MYOMY|nr:hypothetical protein mMyoMyo1_010121 [Myotis myotis]